MTYYAIITTINDISMKFKIYILINNLLKFVNKITARPTCLVEGRTSLFPGGLEEDYLDC